MRSWRPCNGIVSQHPTMSHQRISIAEDRLLTSKEAQLAGWLLAHGVLEAVSFEPQLTSARVVARCGCGCASIDFAVGGRRGRASEGMAVLSDYQWRDSSGNLFGVFVFAYGNTLGGLEVWSIDGQATPTQLPEIEQLSPLGIDDAG